MGIKQIKLFAIDLGNVIFFFALVVPANGWYNCFIYGKYFKGRQPEINPIRVNNETFC